jgi:hypothetical protein
MVNWVESVKTIKRFHLGVGVLLMIVMIVYIFIHAGDKPEGEGTRLGVVFLGIAGVLYLIGTFILQFYMLRVPSADLAYGGDPTTGAAPPADSWSNKLTSGVSDLAKTVDDGTKGLQTKVASMANKHVDAAMNLAVTHVDKALDTVDDAATIALEQVNTASGGALGVFE